MLKQGENRIFTAACSDESMHGFIRDSLEPIPGCCDCVQHDMDGFRPMLIKQVLNKIDCISVCKHLLVRNVRVVLATNRLVCFWCSCWSCPEGAGQRSVARRTYAATDSSSVNAWPWSLYLASILGPW